MQSRRRLNSATVLFIRTAILIFVPILLYVSIVNWRYMWAYREIKANHTETVETNCISVALDRTDEPNGHIPYRQTYNFVLGDGTKTHEYAVDTTGGYKNTRYLDIYASNGTESFGVQIGRVTKGGYPVARERRAILDIMRAGIKVWFDAYN